jgi:hypothetical protein
MQLKGYRGAILILIVTFGSFVLVLEVAAHFYTDVILRYPSIHTYDKLLGWKLRESIEVHRKTQNFSYTIKTNSQGLRSDEVNLEKDPSVYRILILGDSFAFGEGVEVKDRFDRPLKDLQLPGKVVEVVNAGVMGYGTDQELLYFTQKGLNLRPDLVILMSYENDLEDIMTDFNNTRYKPRYIIKDNDLTLTGIPVPIRSQIRDYSYIFTFFYIKYLMKFSNPAKVNMDEAAIAFLRLRDELYHVCQKNNITFVHVVFSGFNSLQTRNLRWKSAIINAADQETIPLIDLDPVFFDQPDVRALFIEGNIHWNAQGSLIVGRVLLDKLGALVRKFHSSAHRGPDPSRSGAEAV